MRNSFAALPMAFKQNCSVMHFSEPPYLRWGRTGGQNVSAHHSRVDHDVAVAHLLPAAQHRQRRWRLPPGRREKSKAAGAALLGEGPGPRGKARKAAGQRHSRLGGIGLLSVLGPGGQGAGLAGVAVGPVGGRLYGPHGGLHAAAAAPRGGRA